MIVNLPDNTSNRRIPDYNVNNVANSPVRYSVIDHNNRQKLYSVYSSRRRRGAGMYCLSVNSGKLKRKILNINSDGINFPRVSSITIYSRLLV